MKILAIETSCDDTAVCVVDFSSDKVSILGDALHSQIKEHSEYGGVYPTLAVREHQKNLCPVLLDVLHQSSLFIKSDAEKDLSCVKEILEREPELFGYMQKYLSDVSAPDIDVIAFTVGPGLDPALWVGVNFAKALSILWGKPLIPTNHMEGHVASSLLVEEKFISPEYPLCALLVSGGHTEIVLSEGVNKYKKLSRTRDDALGEAFDKVGRVLGLPFPGGPYVSQYASKLKGADSNFTFTKPMARDESLDMSFSGLKTAVLRKSEELGDNMTEEDKCHIAKAFEVAAIGSVIIKLKRVLDQTEPKTLVIGGGVSANAYLREELKNLMQEYPDVKMYLPTKELATDNAVMIALAAFWNKENTTSDINNIKAQPNLSL